MSMEIKGTRNVNRSSLRRSSSRQGGGSGFSISTESEEETATQAVGGTTPLTAVDTVLALQEMEDSTEGRSRGLKHGKTLLDALDEVRLGLLSGSIPRETLSRIAQNLSQRNDQFTDPNLKAVLDDIELRARVELAKLEMQDADQHR